MTCVTDWSASKMCEQLFMNSIKKSKTTKPQNTIDMQYATYATYGDSWFQMQFIRIWKFLS